MEGTRNMEPWHDQSGWAAVPFVSWFLTADGNFTLTQIKEAAGLLASVLIVFGSISAGLVFMTGGFKSGNSVAVDEIATKVTAIQRTVEAMQATINAMPRPADYAGQQHHLEQIDVGIGLLGDRVTHDEIGAAEVKARVDSLWVGTSTPARNPR